MNKLRSDIFDALWDNDIVIDADVKRVINRFITVVSKCKKKPNKSGNMPLK